MISKYATQTTDIQNMSDVKNVNKLKINLCLFLKHTHNILPHT